MSMSQSPKLILLQILSEASQKGFRLGKTQLVKLVYLTEVEYYRETGQRLTELDWVFHYYGPYAFEIDKILEEKEFQVETKETKSDRVFHQYKIAESRNEYESFVEARLSLVIKKIVRSWGGKTLEELLDYVYFETEPMQTVERRGDRLDFSRVKDEPVEVIVPLKASRETERKVDDLRKRLAPTLKRLADQRATGGHEGKEYAEAMKAWDQEMEKAIDPDSLKKIAITITKTSHESGKEGN